MKRVAIVGGGISGLSAAYFLARRQIPSTLYEAQSRLGGVIRTERLEGCLVEAGPDSWLSEKAWMLDLISDLGLEDRLIGSNDERRRTYVVRDGRLVRLPESMRLLVPAKPWQVATTPLLGLRSKVRMALEWFRRHAPSEERSVADFVRDHFGDEVVEYLAQPMLAGVYGSPPELLSADQVIPQLVEYERHYGSVLRGAFANRHRRPAAPLFQTLRDGMGELVAALEGAIAGHCDVVPRRVLGLRRSPAGWTVRFEGGEESFDAVVVATPADEAGRLVGSTDPVLASLLGSIAYTSSLLVALVYPGTGFGHPLDGFGLLVPRAERASLAACSWTNTKFDGRVPEGRVLLRAFAAGEAAERAMVAADDAVLADADTELRGWMGIRARRAGGLVCRWSRAMPQYATGHKRLVQRIEDRLGGLAGLHLAGNGYRGLGIPDCVRLGRTAAESIAGA